MRCRSLWVLLLFSSCKNSERRATPEAGSQVHDQRSHDENHFYVAVGTDRFEPEMLSVPAGKEVILLFDRRPGSACAGITLQGEDGSPLERPFSGTTALEIHVRLERRGIHPYGCTSGSPKGSIVVP